jgi:hypothetical protein
MPLLHAAASSPNRRPGRWPPVPTAAAPLTSSRLRLACRSLRTRNHSRRAAHSAQLSSAPTRPATPSSGHHGLGSAALQAGGLRAAAPWPRPASGKRHGRQVAPIRPPPSLPCPGHAAPGFVLQFFPPHFPPTRRTPEGKAQPAFVREQQVEPLDPLGLARGRPGDVIHVLVPGGWKARGRRWEKYRGGEFPVTDVDGDGAREGRAAWGGVRVRGRATGRLGKRWGEAPLSGVRGRKPPQATGQHPLMVSLLRGALPCVAFLYRPTGTPSPLVIASVGIPSLLLRAGSGRPGRRRSCMPVRSLAACRRRSRLRKLLAARGGPPWRHGLRSGWSAPWPALRAARPSQGARSLPYGSRRAPLSVVAPAPARHPGVHA